MLFIRVCCIRRLTSNALSSAAFVRRIFEDEEWKTAANGPHPGVTIRESKQAPGRFDLTRHVKSKKAKTIRTKGLTPKQREEVAIALAQVPLDVEGGLDETKVNEVLQLCK